MKSEMLAEGCADVRCGTVIYLMKYLVTIIRMLVIMMGWVGEAAFSCLIRLLNLLRLFVVKINEQNK